jgi:hypothetical protein
MRETRITLPELILVAARRTRQHTAATPDRVLPASDQDHGRI